MTKFSTNLIMVIYIMIMIRYPFVRRLGADTKGMLGCGERQRQSFIRETFEAAYRSPLSMIILGASTPLVLLYSLTLSLTSKYSFLPR